MIPKFTLLGRELLSYNVFAVLGALAGAALAWRPLRRCGFSRAGAGGLLAGMCAAFLIGARLWNVAVAPETFDDALPWYAPRLAGLSLYGGILGAFIVLAAVCRKRKLPAALDALVLPSGVAFCLSRVGCFLNGCCGGIRTALPWGVVFPKPIPKVDLGVFKLSFEKPVHPTQLYELALAVAGLPLAVWLAKKLRLPEGGRFLLYGIWFCAMRLAILPLRALHYRTGVAELGYPVLYGGLILLGIWLVIYMKRIEKDAHAEA